MPSYVRAWHKNTKANKRLNNLLDVQWTCLIINAIDGLVLFVDLIAHVQSHGLQIPDDAAHLFQVLLHLIFTCIIRYSGQKHLDFIILYCVSKLE